MNDSNDKDLQKLKVRIKRWEKDFLDTNGRKATKRDIDLDINMKTDYKKYWQSIERQNMSEVWNQKLNKSKAKNGSVCHQNNGLNTFSKKMFDKFIKDTNRTTSDTKKFSLKKPKPQLIDNEKTTKPVVEQTATQLDINSMDSSSAPKLNSVLMRAQSIDESILRSISNEFNSNNNFNKQSKDETNSYFQPLVDNQLINNIIDNIDTEECDVRVVPDVVVETQSDSLSNDSLNLNDLQINCSKTRLKRKSDVFDFDDENEDKPKYKALKRSIYTDLDTDYQNSNSRDQPIDGNNEPKSETKRKNKFFVSKDRNNRLNALNAYKQTMNTIIGSNEDSNDFNDNQFTESNTKTISESNEKKTMVTTNENKVNKIPKVRKKVAKKPETNYRRLNIKKKVFCSRGYKKFNVKKYKRLKWKQSVNKNRNNCYKCGASGHWAQDCQFEDKPDEEQVDDQLKGLGVSKAIEDLKQTIQIKPLLSDSEEDNQCSISEALICMGHKDFRHNQEVAIRRILSGKSCLLIASTGSGKSLCYQLPAYLNWKHRKAITLVISPLISLMEDQLTTFPKCLKAVCIHSGLSPTQKQSNLDSLLTGEAQVLLLSPEAITGGNTCINMNALPPIGFVCIDEAHCLSEWSNNFRPSYLQLYRVLRDKLKIKTFLALTATAPKKTSLTIARTIGLDPQNDIIGTTLVPENLVLTVSKDSNKELALIDLLKSQRFNQLKSIIIYCTRREQTERLSSLIRVSFQEIRQTNAKTGKSRIVWDAQPYHAGRTPEERNRVQKRFIKGDLRVIVATIAFGMGINKPDIRGIIHYNLPKSFDNYMQEIGRAGRDGLEAHCHLFLDSDGSDLFELQRHIYSNSTDRKCLRKLIEKVFKSCKCKTIFSLEDNNEFDATVSAENVCVGHEIAFPIESTVLELDLKEETILTLLTYLELEFSSGKVELLAPINSMCTLFCYGDGSQQMTYISKLCPVVGIALTLYQKKNSTDEIPSKLKFDLVEVSSMLGRALSDVRNELRALEWKEFNGRKKRTNVRVMFSDLSFHLRSVGDLSEQQLNQCLEFLYDLTQIQESIEVSKLRNVYFTFKQYSQTVCTNRVNQTKCLQLKNRLNNYFNEDIDPQNELFTDEKFSQLFKGTHVYDLEQARRDVRDLLSIHGSQTLSSARVIARILQGISSPRFPAEVWGKCRRFWRSNININFNELLKIANEELIQLKTV